MVSYTLQLKKRVRMNGSIAFSWPYLGHLPEWELY
jgi:hypothetical protein